MLFSVENECILVPIFTQIVVLCSSSAPAPVSMLGADFLIGASI